MAQAQEKLDARGSAPEKAPPPKGRAALATLAGTPPARRILGVRVDATSYPETSEAVIDMALARRGGMVCVATTHSVMEAHDDAGFRRILNTADRVTPDGVPLVWTLRARGVSEARRVYGPSLMPAICTRAESRGIPVGLYGGSPEVLEALRARLLERFPRLHVPFAWSPPYRPLDEAEEARVVDAIVASGVGVLFVGLGCPKQERWMAAHRDALPCALVGVGAAFDFLAGAKPQAPRLMQRAGLEWLFRLACEPRRLWRRYLVGNSRFVFHLLRERPA